MVVRKWDSSEGSYSNWGLYGLNFLLAPKEGEPGLSYQLARYGAKRNRGVVELEIVSSQKSKMDSDSLLFSANYSSFYFRSHSSSTCSWWTSSAQQQNISHHKSNHFSLSLRRQTIHVTIGSQLGYITSLCFLFSPLKTKQSLAIISIQHSVGKRKN